MIVVDSSVWIDFLRPAPSHAGFELRRMVELSERVAHTGLIVTEILRGLRRDVPRIERFLLQWEMLEPEGLSTYQQAAEISRRASSQGITLKTIDTVIASVAIENGATLFSLDSDFLDIARVSPLRLHTF